MYLSGSSMPYTFCSRAIQKRLVSCFSSPRPFQSAANRAAAVRFSISVIVLPPQKGCCNQYTTPGQKWQSLMERASNASEYPFGYSDASCWGSPKPRTVRFASSRTRLTAWLLSLPLVAPSCTSAQEGKRPFRAFPHIVWDSKKSKYPSCENRCFCFLPDCSQSKNPQGQTRQGFPQIIEFPSWQN